MNKQINNTVLSKIESRQFASCPNPVGSVVFCSNFYWPMTAKLLWIVSKSSKTNSLVK